MNIKIENCNNIKSAEIKIEKGKLNLYYAMNGTGKSTIGNSIYLQSKEHQLTSLQPFGSKQIPKVTFSEEISGVLVFNEDFVNTIVFKESEVIQNAFEIFLKTPKYDEMKQKVEDRIRKIKIDSSSDELLQLILGPARNILSKLSLTTSNQLKKVGVVKSIASSENIYKLPDSLKHFKPFMDKEYSTDWVGWKNEGYTYDDNAICPFCTNELPSEYDNEKKNFTAAYSKSNVKNIKEITSYIEGIEKLIIEDKLQSLYKALKEDNDFDQINLILSKIYLELDYLSKKYDEIQSFNSFRINSADISEIDNKLDSLKIDITNLEYLRTGFVHDEVNKTNELITSIISEANLLKIEIGQLKSIINGSSKKAMSDINEFLELSGINYYFKIIQDKETSAKSLLVFKGDKEDIELTNIRQHLSWGERNAFALVLFLHFALNENPDIVILDDPISSFDSNKKYAIINRLFHQNSKKDSLYQKTVLMMSHDFQPLIDFIINKMPCTDSFIGSFLMNNNGYLESSIINDSDIETMPVMLKRNAKNESLSIIYRITSLRKYIEHTTESVEDDVVYNLLSCLIHSKRKPSYSDETEIKSEDVLKGENIIQEYISGFEYYKTFEAFTRESLVKLYKNETNSYYRLQVFRILLIVCGLKKEITDSILMKYIDEQFHVENDYMYFLDMNKFNIVPLHIDEKCKEYLKAKKII